MAFMDGRYLGVESTQKRQGEDQTVRGGSVGHRYVPGFPVDGKGTQP